MKPIPLAGTGLALLLLCTGASRIASNAMPHTDPAAPGYSWPAADVDEDGVFDRVDRCPGTPPGVEVDHCGCPMASVELAISPPRDYPPGVGSADRGPANRPGRIRLDMAFFRTDRAELEPAARRALLEVAEVIRAYPTLKFEISGHADSRGTDAHNRELSRRRAEAVKGYLVESGGVRPIQLVARGYGESRLAAEERDATGYRANRRVEFRCVNPEAMPRGARVDPFLALDALAAQRDRSAARDHVALR